MELITRRTLAATAASRWRQAYGRGAVPERLAVLARLDALGPNPPPDDVDAAMGEFESLTRVPRCDGCLAKGDVLVEFFKDPEYDGLCPACLLAAVELAHDADPVKAFALAVLRGDPQAVDAAKDVLVKGG